METTSLSAEQQEYVSVIQSSSKALLSLVNDILDLTRLQSSKLRVEIVDFQLTSTIDSVMEVVAGNADDAD